MKLIRLFGFLCLALGLVACQSGTTESSYRYTVTTPELAQPSVSDGGVTIAWDENPYAAYFKLYIATSSMFGRGEDPEAYAARIGARVYTTTSISHTLTDLSKDTGYFYFVVAYREGGDRSELGEEHSLAVTQTNTLLTNVIVLDAPTSSELYSFSLNWSDAGVSGYRAYASQNAIATDASVADLADAQSIRTTGTSAQFGRKWAQSYWFVVHGLDADGNVVARSLPQQSSGLAHITSSEVNPSSVSMSNNQFTQRVACGDGVSPHLDNGDYNNASATTASRYHVIIERLDGSCDPSADDYSCLHLNLMNIPLFKPSLQAGEVRNNTSDALPTRGVLGRNKDGEKAYAPICPDDGNAEYRISWFYTLSALAGVDASSDFSYTRDSFAEKFVGNILDEARVTGSANEYQPTLSIASSDITDGVFSNANACIGGNQSPQFTITSNIDTTSFTSAKFHVILEDRDPNACATPCIHLNLMNINPSDKVFAQGAVPNTVGAYSRGTLLNNYQGSKAYAGMCPPSGSHPYHLIVIATKSQVTTTAYSHNQQTFTAAFGDQIIKSASVEGSFRIN